MCVTATTATTGRMAARHPRNLRGSRRYPRLNFTNTAYEAELAHVVDTLAPCGGMGVVRVSAQQS